MTTLCTVPPPQLHHSCHSSQAAPQLRQSCQLRRYSAAPCVGPRQPAPVYLQCVTPVCSHYYYNHHNSNSHTTVILQLLRLPPLLPGLRP